MDMNVEADKKATEAETQPPTGAVTIEEQQPPTECTKPNSETIGIFEEGSAAVYSSATITALREEEADPIIDGQSYCHAMPNLVGKETDDPISTLLSLSSSSTAKPASPQPIVTFPIEKSSDDEDTVSRNRSGNSTNMDLTFSLCDDDEDEEDDDEDDMDDGDGAEYDISTGSTITGSALATAGGGAAGDMGASSILFDDIQFFPSSHSHHRSLRLQQQFQFHQDQLTDPNNFHLAPNLSCFDASGMVSLGGDHDGGSANSVSSNSFSHFPGDSSSGDINSAFSVSFHFFNFISSRFIVLSVKFI